MANFTSHNPLNVLRKLLALTPHTDSEEGSYNGMCPARELIISSFDFKDLANNKL